MANRANGPGGAARGARRVNPWLIPVFVLVVGLVASWGVFAWRSRVIDQETQSRLEGAGRDAGRRVTSGLDDYAGLLQNAGAFWSTRGTVTPQEFEAYGIQIDWTDRYKTLEDVELLKTPGGGSVPNAVVIATISGKRSTLATDRAADSDVKTAMLEAAQTGRA